VSESRYQWARKSLDELVDFYYSEIRPAMREAGYDPEGEWPRYGWLADHGFGGLSRTLRDHHNLTLKEFFVDEVGIGTDTDRTEDGDGYDWGIRNGDTIDAITTYLSTQRDRGELAASTIRSRRSRLAEYGRLYEQEHGAVSIVRNLDDLSTRSEENNRCMAVLDKLNRRLSTDQSRLKYLSDIQQFYDFQIRFNGATYNPVEGANKQFRWKVDSQDNQTVDAEGMRAIYEAADTISNELLVLALGAWGLRPNEVAALTADQFVIGDDDDDRIVFEERKNGPGEVTVLFGIDVLTQRIHDLDGQAWSGYLFPSPQSSCGHITAKTVTNRFKRLADDAGVTVEGETPTAKMGRRFWYATYNDAMKQMLAGLEDIAADQGSSSAQIVSDNYLSQAEKRRYRRDAMREELSRVFDTSGGDDE
jgi:integrase